ncbi:MAG: outer membrane protein assembly factor BamE [Gammaproteobacteria bacterium]
MQKLLISLLAGAVLMVSACSLPSIPGAYKIDIPQGNIITQEMVDKLKPGMDKSQVVFALGSPMLVDVFHQERWDYVYSLQPGGQDRQQRRISLFFEDGKLKRVEGDVKAGSAQRAPQDKKESTVTVDAPVQEQGFFSRLKGAFGLGDKDSTPSPAPESTQTTPPNQETTGAP